MALGGVILTVPVPKDTSVKDLIEKSAVAFDFKELKYSILSSNVEGISSSPALLQTPDVLGTCFS